MKTFKSSFTPKNIIASIVSTLVVALFVWWGMHFPGSVPVSIHADTFPINCLATPTPTPIVDGTALPSLTCTPYATAYPTVSPAAELLSTQFQNPNGAKLAWIPYNGDQNNRRPGVLVIHGSNWNSGEAGDQAGQTRQIAINGGFFAASVWYELAPNEDITAPTRCLVQVTFRASLAMTPTTSIRRDSE